MLACQRHFADLDRKAEPGFNYKFDHDRAHTACEFIEALPHTKGKWAQRGEPIVLQPWQKFIICSLFGWVHRVTGHYRYTEAYVCVPRKNGKSIIAAAIGHFKFSADGEFGAEVYSGATSEKQAWEVFRPAKLMAERTPDYTEAFGITINAKSLVIEENGNRFEPVIGKPGDGASPSCAIIDEYHEHQTDDLVDTMRTGMGARDNPLLFKITTAGSDYSSPCHANQQDAYEVLQGRWKNDRFFAIIFTIDEDDDWKSDAAAAKANPNWGISVSPDIVLATRDGAIQSARKQGTYKIKHLGIWLNAGISWMNMDKWDAMSDPTLSIDDFAKQECDIGIDLASRNDLASKVRVFAREVDGKRHYYVFADHYINEFRVEEVGAKYQGWATDGFLHVTPGNITDYVWIHEGLVDDSRKYIVRSIPHDPHHADPLVQFIKAREDWDQNIEFAEIAPSVANFSAPMKELEALIFAGRLHHNGDPVLTWMVGNVICSPNSRENIYPLKEKNKPNAKIDGAVALIMALSRAIYVENFGVLTVDAW